jgi:hypothetical protein
MNRKEKLFTTAISEYCTLSNSNEDMQTKEPGVRFVMLDERCAISASIPTSLKRRAMPNFKYEWSRVTRVGRPIN